MIFLRFLYIHLYFVHNDFFTHCICTIHLLMHFHSHVLCFDFQVNFFFNVIFLFIYLLISWNFFMHYTCAFHMIYFPICALSLQGLFIFTWFIHDVIFHISLTFIFTCDAISEHSKVALREKMSYTSHTLHNYHIPKLFPVTRVTCVLKNIKHRHKLTSQTHAHIYPHTQE